MPLKPTNAFWDINKKSRLKGGSQYGFSEEVVIVL
jgi:hypothetical protein